MKAAIFWGGGVAATIDIVYAVLRNWGNGRAPLWTLQSVATGWLGQRSFDGGLATGLLGLASHYAILFVAAAIYWAASRKLIVLRTQWLVPGLLFGIAVYLFMNFVVLKLSAFPFHLTYTWSRLLEGFFSHAVGVGLPIAYAAYRFTAHRDNVSK
jgi:hypothetical protein